MSSGAASPMRFGAAFDTPHHRPFVFTGTGRGAALFVHGFPGTPAEMRSLGRLLNADGWTAEGLLLPGFGHELDSVAAKTHTDWIAAVTAALRRLRAEHPRVLLVGHSLGGALALAAAVECPPDGLIALAPFWKIDHVLWSLLPAIKTILPQFKPFKLIKLDLNDPKFREGAANFMPGLDLDDPQVQAGMKDFAIPTRLFNELRRAGQRGADAARQITVPTLILQGEADTLVKPALTAALVERTQGRARYVVTPGQHDLIDPHGAGWEQVRAAAAGFAQEVAQP